MVSSGANVRLLVSVSEVVYAQVMSQNIYLLSNQKQWIQ